MSVSTSVPVDLRVGKTWVCIGPTLTHADVMAILPEAEILPPIAAGDLWNLPLQPGDTLAIIDGLFLQCRSIRHKELIDAMHRGVRVAGAASLGALRAAELERAGMIGMGMIFHWYVDRVIEGDDEVAVVHRDAQDEYRQVTRALVDLRATFARAVSTGVMSESLAAEVIAIIGSMPFGLRDDDTIVERLTAASGHGSAQVYQQAVRDCWVDAKAEDARALLHAIANDLLPESSIDLPAHETACLVSRVTLFWDWSVNEPVELTEAGERISGRQVLGAARIFAGDLPQIVEAAAMEDALRDAAACIGDERVEPDRALLILMASRGFLDGPDDRLGLRRLTDPFLLGDEFEVLTDEDRVRTFLRRTHGAPWRAPAVAVKMRERGQWDRWRETAARIKGFNASIRARRPSFNHHAIPVEQMRSWCAQRWIGEPEPDGSTWRLILADRGYSNEGHWRADARWAFPFAKLRSDRYSDLAH